MFPGVCVCGNRFVHACVCGISKTSKKRPFKKGVSDVQISSLFIKYICLDKLDVYSLLNGPTTEFNEATADASCEWRLCKFIVKSALRLHCFEIIPLGLCTFFFTCK